MPAALRPKPPSGIQSGAGRPVWAHSASITRSSAWPGRVFPAHQGTRPILCSRDRNSIAGDPKASKAYLAAMIDGRKLAIKRVGKDRYARRSLYRRGECLMRNDEGRPRRLCRTTGQRGGLCAALSPGWALQQFPTVCDLRAPSEQSATRQRSERTRRHRQWPKRVRSRSTSSKSRCRPWGASLHDCPCTRHALCLRR